MMLFLFLFFLSVVAVEAATELLVKSVIFSKLRDWITTKGGRIKEIVSCGYCASVWVSILPALFLSCSQEWVSPVVMFPLVLLAVHRCANFLHNINDNYFDKFYRNTGSEE